MPITLPEKLRTGNLRLDVAFNRLREYVRANHIAGGRGLKVVRDPCGTTLDVIIPPKSGGGIAFGAGLDPFQIYQQGATTPNPTSMEMAWSLTQHPPMVGPLQQVRATGTNSPRRRQRHGEPSGTNQGSERRP
jgi:hypothetical protein